MCNNENSTSNPPIGELPRAAEPRAQYTCPVQAWPSWSPRPSWSWPLSPIRSLSPSFPLLNGGKDKNICRMKIIFAVSVCRCDSTVSSCSCGDGCEAAEGGEAVRLEEAGRRQTVVLRRRSDTLMTML